MNSSTRMVLIRAMIEIISEDGFDGLSVRSVATRAGASPGAVQHHFASKSAMLDAAMDAIVLGTAARAAELEAIADPGERLRAIVEVLVPAETDDRVTRVWLAFAARAAVDQQTRTAYKHLWGRLRGQLRILIAASSGRPETAEHASVELLALLDGLALSITSEHQDPALARRIALERLDSLIQPNP